MNDTPISVLLLERDRTYQVTTEDGCYRNAKAKFAGDDIPGGSYCHVWWLYSAGLHMKVEKWSYRSVEEESNE